MHNHICMHICVCKYIHMLCSLGKTTWPAPEAMLDALASVALKQKSVWCGYERESIVNATTFTNAFIRIYIYCSYTIPKKNSWHLLAMDDSLLYKLYSSLRQCVTCNLKKRLAGTLTNPHLFTCAEQTWVPNVKSTRFHRLHGHRVSECLLKEKEKPQNWEVEPNHSIYQA